MNRLTGLSAMFLAAVFGAASLAGEIEIRPEKAAIRTEGGPAKGGGWNLWSNGRVGQPLRVTAGGTYRVVVRAGGSPAAGVWPEMAMVVDGRAAKTVTVGQAEHKDYSFEVNLTPGVHEVAAGFLNDALVTGEDRNLYLDRITIVSPPGAPDPTLPDARELVEAAETRERQIVAATEVGIEEHRKADAKVLVVDAEGRPVAGVKTRAEQTGHDFLFGGNIYMFDRCRTEAQNAAFKERFQELFNYATVGFYWRWYERERGKPDYPYTDKVVAWCLEHGIRMKGHPLLWGDEAGVPVWSRGQPAAEVQRQRVEEIMHRYQGKVHFWEVVNEPSHLPQLGIDDPYRWARQADPRAYLIGNDYHVLADGCPGFFRLLSEATREGVPFDGVGIQAHEPRTLRFPLERVQEILDQYATLGKDLHITEFTPASSGQEITGSHPQGIWDEAAQADYAVKFYRVCFAHPAMRAVTWWDLCDQGSWLRGGGMLRADMTPKPVYEQLKRLIHEEWRTKASGTTDAEGRFAFRGFRGTYRVEIELPGRRVERDFRLAKAGPSEWKIVLGLER